MMCLVDSQHTMCKLSEVEMKSLKENGYNIQGMISEGSYSLVYWGEYEPKPKNEKEDAFPKNIPFKVAYKVMETNGSHPDFCNKFLPRELTIHSRISHPYIIALHSILQINTKIIMITRYAERGNLCDHLQKYGELREKQARHWFRQMVVALSYLHSMNLAHRDLKCENILITSNNNVKLCDFGFSRQVVDTTGRNVYSRTYCGSLPYAAPELIKGVPYDPTIADMWALGVVLYAMLNGSLPFHTDSFMSLQSIHLDKDYRFRREVLMRTSSKAVKLVDQLLEPNWFKRLNIEETFKSDWIAMEPQLTELTPMEASALVNIKDFTMKKKIRMTKNLPE